MSLASYSLSIELHDVVIWHSADWALIASPSALDTSCHVATRNECSVTLVLIAQLAHLSLSSVRIGRSLGL